MGYYCRIGIKCYSKSTMYKHSHTFSDYKPIFGLTIIAYKFAHVSLTTSADFRENANRTLNRVIGVN